MKESGSRGVKESGSRGVGGRRTQGLKDSGTQGRLFTYLYLPLFLGINT